jgi:hypothetical protein
MFYFNDVVSRLDNNFVTKENTTETMVRCDVSAIVVDHEEMIGED